MVCYSQITDYLHDSFNMGYIDLSVKKTTTQKHKSHTHKKQGLLSIVLYFYFRKTGVIKLFLLRKRC